MIIEEEFFSVCRVNDDNDIIEMHGDVSLCFFILIDIQIDEESR